MNKPELDNLISLLEQFHNVLDAKDALSISKASTDRLACALLGQSEYNRAQIKTVIAQVKAFLNSTP